MFCCEPFQRRVENAGNRGLSFLVVGVSQRFIFFAQSRGVDSAEEDNIRHFPATVNLVSEFAITYCPFCGIRLDALTQKHAAVFEQLAEKHRAFSVAATNLS